MDDRAALAPPAWDIETNGEAEIFDGVGDVQIGEAAHRARIRVWFSWESGVRVRAHGRGDVRPLWLPDHDVDVVIVTSDLPPFTASVLDSDVQVPDGPWSVDGSAITDAVPTDSCAHRVDFQVANFTTTWGTRSWALIDGEHRIELVPHPNVRERTAELKLTRRGATTYLGRLTRADGEAMTWDEVTEILTALQFLLTFAAGDLSPVLLPTSFDATGRLTGAGLRSPRRESYQGRLSWCTAFHLEALPSLWLVFRDLWSQPDLRQLLQLCLSLYVEAQHGDLLETRLVHAVTLLEALAWDRLVRTGQRDPRKVDGEKMAWRIRKLLQSLGAPVEVPSDLTDLQAWRKGGDGPTVITRLRHAIVHPTSLADVFEASPETKLDVLNLAMWYADLALLKLLEHDGDHLRRAQQLPIFAGRGEPVPWTPEP